MAAFALRAEQHRALKVFADPDVLDHVYRGVLPYADALVEAGVLVADPVDPVTPATYEVTPKGRDYLAQRREVKPPKWGYYPTLERGKHTIEVGARQDRGDAYHHAERTLSQYEVFLDGAFIGTVESFEATSDFKPRGSRIVTRRTHPVEWASHPTEYTARSTYVLTRKTKVEAVYRLVEDTLAHRAREAKKEQQA